MTLSANWDNDGHVAVRCTSGPVTFEVTEDKGSAAAFWSQLGRVLAVNRSHVEAQAALAYNRYRDHAHGESVHGEPLPHWDETHPEIRDHWIAAVGG